MCKKLRNFGTVPPIFANRVLKCARDVKEKSHEISARELFALKNYCEKCRGGAKLAPPPPPPPPGLLRVKGWSWTEKQCLAIFPVSKIWDAWPYNRADPGFSNRGGGGCKRIYLGFFFSSSFFCILIQNGIKTQNNKEKQHIVNQNLGRGACLLCPAWIRHCYKLSVYLRWYKKIKALDIALQNNCMPENQMDLVKPTRIANWKFYIWYLYWTKWINHKFHIQWNLIRKRSDTHLS